MKKILILTILMITMLSCDKKEDYTYKAVYKIYYSENNIRTKSISANEPLKVVCYKGTNFLANELENKKYDESIAPIEIVSQTRTNNKTKVVDHIIVNKTY